VLEVVNLLLDRKIRKAPNFVMDHMPRAPAVDIWND
jgi:hypothetical protein